MSKPRDVRVGDRLRLIVPGAPRRTCLVVTVRELVPPYFKADNGLTYWLDAFERIGARRG